MDSERFDGLVRTSRADSVAAADLTRPRWCCCGGLCPRAERWHPGTGSQSGSLTRGCGKRRVPHGDGNRLAAGVDGQVGDLESVRALLEEMVTSAQSEAGDPQLCLVCQ